MSTEPVDSDRLGDFPHPRETHELLGHETAEAAFVDCWQSGRTPHAWLIGGPHGIGKATFAYRIARALLNQGSDASLGASLDVDKTSAAARRIEQQSHANLLVLRRPWDPVRKKVKTVLTVDEVRRIAGFFGMSAGEGGWRICIVDTADDMNAAAANALLKTLEEPPEKSLLLVLSNVPGRLLATLRSRCRRLALSPLSNTDMTSLLTKHAPDLSAADQETLIELSMGSIGRALLLAQENGLVAHRQLMSVLGTLPGLDDQALSDLSSTVARRGSEQIYHLTMDFLAEHVRRQIAKTALEDDAGIGHQGDELCSYMTGGNLDRWIGVWENLRRLQNMTDALNLDRKQTLTQAFFRIQEVCASGRAAER